MDPGAAHYAHRRGPSVKHAARIGRNKRTRTGQLRWPGMSAQLSGAGVNPDHPGRRVPA